MARKRLYSSLRKGLQDDNGAFAGSNGIDAKTAIIIGRQYIKRVLPLIQGATVSIDILMFHWAWYKDDLSCEISQLNAAIVRAQKLGIKVRCFCHMKKAFDILKSVGVDVKLYKGDGIMHCKLVILDDKTAIMGSHNFSQNAMCFNKEISVIIDTLPEVAKLKLFFDSLWRMNV
jgi:phosphatidylserine/phosphatidylglycerophosphate/cardiolipin synthase-like enzyme